MAPPAGVPELYGRRRRRCAQKRSSSLRGKHRCGWFHEFLLHPGCNRCQTVGVVGAFGIGLVLTAFGFGFRHGIDWDHIAALTDITGSQDEGRRSMVLATMYALGHALVVLVLGVAAIVAAERLPSSIDGGMGRGVGATLLMPGVSVLVPLLRQGRDFRMQSRWMLVFSGVRGGIRWVRRPRRADDNRAAVVVIDHEHAHAPAEPHPDTHR